MIKNLIFASLFMVLTLPLAKADDNLKACNVQIPFGAPTNKNTEPNRFYPVCHTAYLTDYDTAAKHADWVSYTLTPDHVLGCEPRTNNFSVDPDLNYSQASPKDYDHMGYDRGHLANAEDMAWSVKTENESFYMTNMTPQLPNFNRGIWKRLEDAVRYWAVYRNENLTVYTGPIYDLLTDKKFSKNVVDIPSGFYKIVLDDSSNEAIAFVFENQVITNGDNLLNHLTSINKIETLTGINFPVPQSVNKNEVSEMWPFEKGEFQHDKLKQCKGN